MHATVLKWMIMASRLQGWGCDWRPTWWRWSTHHDFFWTLFGAAKLTSSRTLLELPSPIIAWLRLVSEYRTPLPPAVAIAIAAELLLLPLPLLGKEGGNPTTSQVLDRISLCCCCESATFTNNAAAATSSSTTPRRRRYFMEEKSMGSGLPSFLKYFLTVSIFKTKISQLFFVKTHKIKTNRMLWF